MPLACHSAFCVDSLNDFTSLKQALEPRENIPAIHAGDSILPTALQARFLKAYPLPTKDFTPLPLILKESP